MFHFFFVFRFSFLPAVSVGDVDRHRLGKEEGGVAGVRRCVYVCVLFFVLSTCSVLWCCRGCVPGSA